MELENYTFMQFIPTYFLWFGGAAVTIFTGLYGIRASQPKAFTKLQKDVLPIGFVIMIGLMALMLLGERLNLGLNASILKDLPLDQNAGQFQKDRVETLYEQNRRTSLLIDLLLFGLMALAITAYAMDFIEWLLIDEDEEERKENGQPKD
ncbi:hypothetical protein [Roseovarius nanhaiticus]|uniref:Uncharacterized protein n=1 Tax=Roseovarius nanhaiticus TaxID=573024 RepID=A0A1N7FFG9_9RHOB|nr:hypothetical protein [Roseovarius nanhaiticus]SEK55729.1 hypothetical protein SAMN05216208_1143 [Roseovarius nanhaiticus]SIR99081.1 hypothetical protein SAMN05421666_0993 [Roseovarius nanhaiticus]